MQNRKLPSIEDLDKVYYLDMETGLIHHKTTIPNDLHLGRAFYTRAKRNLPLLPQNNVVTLYASFLCAANKFYWYFVTGEEIFCKALVQNPYAKNPVNVYNLRCPALNELLKDHIRDNIPTSPN